MKDLFAKTVELLKQYLESSSLDREQQRSLSEAIARLESISSESAEIIEQNARLLEADPKLREIRELMTDDKINEMMQEQAKKDPNLAAHLATVGRLTKKSSSEVIARDMGKLDDQTKPDNAKLKELHSKTESMYQKLWVIKERLNQTPKFKNFNPPGVRDVRNHLIEHTDKGPSGASIYSFGLATNGPVLRPMKPTGARAPHDAGLETNLEEFLRKIVSRLS